MSERPSTDRLVRIRRYVAEECSAYSTAAALLAELDAVTKERDEAQEWRTTWGDCVDLWMSVYSKCVSEQNDAALAEYVRRAARHFYRTTAIESGDEGRP